ncbi:MAG: thioredoxin family protein [Nitrospirae bacterium]|nr:thioredoxin family protein [Nitrospirota bacterium]MBI3351298.1 thioredoxin family protein [Nitrospirota bacterium]
MIILELFLSPRCISASSAMALAKEAVRKVPGVKMIVRSEKEDRSRAKSLGIFIFPTIVLDGEVFSVGEPRLEHLVQVLKDKTS